MSPADLVGREYDVRVERLGGGGEGIASIDGLVTFVRGALPGETARVRVTKAYASYAAAELVELTDAAPERTAPACPLFGRCGGCALMHMSYRRELEYKQKLVADALERVGGFQDVGVADVLGDFGPDGADFSPRYRNKGQYAVSPSAIGFVAAGSHTVVGVDDCLLQKPGGALILREISAWIGAFGIGPAELTDIVIRTGEHTGEVMVVLVSQTGRLRGLGALADRLFCAVPGLRSLTVNHNPIPRGARKRPALGAKFSLAAGDPTIRDTLSGLSFSISPAAFFQVNTRMAERLCDQILALSGVTPADTVFDLYCGVGSISLCLARGADNVIGVEVSQTAVADARENAARNGIKNTTFLAERTEVCLARLRRDGIRPNLVVLDPPRKGCAPEVLDALAVSGARRIVYVSCEPQTLARDLARLCAAGPYHILTVRPVDLFARTANVETVALLERR